MKLILLLLSTMAMSHIVEGYMTVKPDVGRLTSLNSVLIHGPSPSKMSAEQDAKSLQSSYKSSMRTGVLSVLTSVAVGVGSKRASAQVFMDSDAYGDKELKQAAINNLKQRLRNRINQQPELAKGFYELAVTDGLGYDSKSGDGGMDGSFSLEGPPDSFAAAVKEITSLKNELQTTLSVSLADVTAYAGAEACEAIGAPRIVVNLGRSDSKGKNKKEPAFNIWGESSEASVASAKAMFTESGLSTREITALLVAHGELRRTFKEVQAKAAQAKAEAKDDDDDASELDGDEAVFVPTSFGRRDEIWGPKLTDSFSNRYVSELLKAAKKSAPSEINLTLLDRVLIEDAECKAVAQGFASSNKDFLEALPSAYQRLSTQGQTFSRAKD